MAAKGGISFGIGQFRDTLMRLLQLSTMQRWSLRIIGGICALIFLFWGACHLFLPGVIKNAAGDYGKKIGYEIGYQDLSISPLRLRIELEGLHLADQHRNTLLELKKSVVMLNWSSLMAGEIGFGEITLSQPAVRFEKHAAKGAKGQWNWQEFLVDIQKQLPPPDPGKPKKNIKISVDALIVSGATVLIADPSVKLREEFGPLSIEVLNVANYDLSGEIDGVRGQYGLNLGALHFTLPGLNKKLAFNRVVVKGALDNSAPGALGAQVDFEIDEGRIRSHWDLKGDKSIAGKLQVENFSISPFIPLLPANKELQGKSGTIQSEVMLDLRGGELIASGDFHLLDLDVWEPGQKHALLSWKSADINRFAYKSAKTTESSLTIEELLINHPGLRFEIDEKGFSNFRRLFSKPVNAEDDQKAGAIKSEKNSKSSAFHYDVGKIQFRDGEMAFSDLAMKPNFEVDVRRFNASLSGVTNAPGKSALVDIEGMVARSGAMRIKGQASFDDPRRNNDLSLNFKNMPLNAFNPAAMNFAGYQIVGGRLNLNLRYQAKDGELKGSNQIVIKKVELGEEVPNFQGKKLPLGLAIALLEDSDDTIDVTINIAGNVDSPEFSASGLVWQAIANVLTNVATAPFRALGALLGMGSSDGVNAVLGEVVYLPPDQDRLEKFGDFLAKRPNATLELVGTYDPAQDKEALARAIASTAILKASGIKLSSNEPVPSLNLADAKTQAGLRSAYIERVGRIKLGQRLLMLPEGDARNQQLYAELVAAIPVGDVELKALAKNRAKLASELMVKNNPNLQERIMFGDVKTASSAKEGVPLEVEVRIK